MTLMFIFPAKQNNQNIYRVLWRTSHVNEIKFSFVSTFDIQSMISYYCCGKCSYALFMDNYLFFSDCQYYSILKYSLLAQVCNKYTHYLHFLYTMSRAIYMNLKTDCGIYFISTGHIIHLSTNKLK